ncbi:Growth_factor receptor cysteine-rich domain superfamily [Hexamita inflata]|uniref:Growth factor receptor cysteine-rich domain superfamily n=1 Tax=Hexamita inflata TaxID=28002 RepID=A0AA86NIF9_9EUKA|nr:Growth factor receptor cysteine-rich domain superfamily [Hexamita inflata]
MQRVGIAEQLLNIIGVETKTCQQVCSGEEIVTFGICYDKIQFATTLENFTQICADPFYFDSLNNICVCQYGYYLNGSVCVNVINEFSEILLNISALDVKLHTEIQQTDLELKTIFYNLEKEIQTNISNLSQFVFETYSDLKQDINTTNTTLHDTFEVLNTNMDLKFKLSSDQNIMTQSIINGFKTETSANFSVVNTKLGNLNSLITENNLNVTKNFTQVLTQISDLKSTIITNFDQVDTALVGLKADVTGTNSSVNTLNSNINTKFVALNSLINDNYLNLKNNFTQTQTQISDLKTLMITNFDQVDTALIGVKTDISSTNTNINTKFVSLNTLLNDNQVITKNNFAQIQTQITDFQTAANINFDEIDTVLLGLKTSTARESSVSSLYTFVGTRATQSYLTDVYNSLTSQINALKTATNPCAAWPGSINEGGFCRCVYGQQPTFCKSANKCCVNNGYGTISCIGGGSYGEASCHQQVYANG